MCLDLLLLLEERPVEELPLRFLSLLVVRFLTALLLGDEPLDRRCFLPSRLFSFTLADDPVTDLRGLLALRFPRPAAFED